MLALCITPNGIFEPNHAQNLPVYGILCGLHPAGPKNASKITVSHDEFYLHKKWFDNEYVWLTCKVVWMLGWGYPTTQQLFDSLGGWMHCCTTVCTEVGELTKALCAQIKLMWSLHATAVTSCHSYWTKGSPPFSSLWARHRSSCCLHCCSQVVHDQTNHGSAWSTSEPPLWIGTQKALAQSTGTKWQECLPLLDFTLTPNGKKARNRNWLRFSLFPLAAMLALVVEVWNAGMLETYG